MQKRMDFIYVNGEERFLIETLQRDTRTDVIRRYVECRKAQGMTQEDLARRSGISRPNIARFESGRYNPSLEMLVKVAAALNMSLEINLKTMNK